VEETVRSDSGHDHRSSSRGSCRPGATSPRPALVPAVLLLALAAGCGGTKSYEPVTRLQPFTAEERQLYEAAADAQYRLRVGDTFRVAFKFEQQLNQENIRILPDGRFTMAGMEGVYAVGMTVAELDSAITAHFGRDYRSPDLSVIMQELGSEQVYVFGNVVRPGLVDLPQRGGSVLQAIAMAGGFAKGAQKEETVLIRVTPEGYLHRKYSLAHIEKQPLDYTLWDLQPYDIIYVPQSTLGDFGYFGDMVLRNLWYISRVFWDVYAISNLDKVDVLTR
jgi:protein involved in polysaccharide export with SLBB domain